MRRLFWVGLGAAAGILIARQVREAAQQLTPNSLASRAAASAQEFWAAAREYAAEREIELREAFGLDEE